MQELYEQLKQYAQSDFYPWHMPGHKRRLVEFENPFSLDITEIDGFDDLHHPDGILKEAMEEAARIYGAKQTWFLVNGSSCGILAAVSAAVKPGGKLLMARNCHKSAYYGALLRQLEVTYVYPRLEKEGFYGALDPDTVEAMLQADPQIEAVMMVSPGYEGVVSDVSALAQVAHAHGCALLVDEAHGAHLPFGKQCGDREFFPAGALEQGADVVIQSVHKTLPSLTQTALLHLGKGSDRVRPQQIARYLQIYQSSSPSYILMASIDHCIRLMAGEKGARLMREYAVHLKKYRSLLRENLQYLRLYESSGACDPSKFVILGDGVRLAETLRREYHLESEMHTDSYVILMSSPADSREGFERMTRALLEVDRLWKQEAQTKAPGVREDHPSFRGTALPRKAPRTACLAARATDSDGEWIMLEESNGRICCDYIYIYPPGIPLLVPGEYVDETVLQVIRNYQKHGLEVHGLQEGAIRCMKGLPYTGRNLPN